MMHVLVEVVSIVSAVNISMHDVCGGGVSMYVRVVVL